jgi:hypothetical protein
MITIKEIKAETKASSSWTCGSSTSLQGSYPSEFQFEDPRPETIKTSAGMREAFKRAGLR